METMKWVTSIRNSTSSSGSGSGSDIVVQIWDTAGHDGPRVADDNLALTAAEVTFLTSVVKS